MTTKNFLRFCPALTSNSSFLAHCSIITSLLFVLKTSMSGSLAMAWVPRQLYCSSVQHIKPDKLNDDCEEGFNNRSRGWLLVTHTKCWQENFSEVDNINEIKLILIVNQQG